MMWLPPSYQIGSVSAETGCECLVDESPIVVVAVVQSVDTAYVQSGVSWLTQKVKVL